MSIEVYSVPLLDLLALPGSGGHEELLDLIEEECPFREEVDALLDEEYFGADNSEREVASLVDAVAQIINGDELNGPAFIYPWAYKAICGGLGSNVAGPNDTTVLSLEAFDSYLLHHHVPLRFKDLCYAGCLLDLPDAEDYPLTGWWCPEQIARGAAGLETLNLTDEDEEVVRSAYLLQTLLEEALDRECDVLIGFVD